MTPVVLDEWVRERASAIVAAGEDLLPVVWTLTPDGWPLGVFLTSAKGFGVAEQIAPAVLVARAHGTPVLLLAASGHIRRYPSPPEALVSPDEDPEAAETVLIYSALGGDCTVAARELHRGDRGEVTLGAWERLPLTEGLIHHALVQAVGARDADAPEVRGLADAAAESWGLHVVAVEPG